MSRKGKRCHHLVLYPLEDESHKKAIQYIVKRYSFAFIHHNRDFYDDNIMDVDGNIIHSKGEIKKAHTHIVVCFNYQRTASSFAKELNIKENYIDEDIKEHALPYLIHLYDSDKVQYDIDEVFGNLKNDLITIINKHHNNENQTILSILAYLDSQKKILSITEVVRWSCENGYWSELRRGGTWLMRCIEEHNQKHLKSIQSDINDDIYLREAEQIRLKFKDLPNF